jgi:hypothetical protein
MPRRKSKRLLGLFWNAKVFPETAGGRVSAGLGSTQPFGPGRKQPGRPNWIRSTAMPRPVTDPGQLAIASASPLCWASQESGGLDWDLRPVASLPRGNRKWIYRFSGIPAGASRAAQSRSPTCRLSTPAGARVASLRGPSLRREQAQDSTSSLGRPILPQSH